MINLKEKAIKGILWSTIDRFLVQIATFTIGIILARILSPADYGVIGMLSIFIALAKTFIESGFISAVIQKYNRTEEDFYTIFYFNFGISVIMYLFIFIISPYIALFFNTPQLDLITKVIALNFVFESITLIPRAKLIINVNFKDLTKISIISILFSGTLGIILAINNYGIWALVYQGLAQVIVQVILFFKFTKWRPKLIFSMTSLNTLAGFGSKILISNLTDTIFKNIYFFVIGKYFSANDLGQYSRAKQFESLPSDNISDIIQRVTYPLLCELQNDDKRLINAYQIIVRLTCFLIFPVMLILTLIAKPLIIILLTDKWLPSVSLFQILCFAGMVFPLHETNLNLLKTKGRSDLYLRLEIIKKCLITVTLITTVPFGLKSMVIGQVLISLIALIINTYFTGKYFNYGLFKQLNDISPFFLISISIFWLLSNTLQFVTNNWCNIFINIASFLMLYYLALKIFNIKELQQIAQEINNYRKRG